MHSLFMKRIFFVILFFSLIFLFTVPVQTLTIRSMDGKTLFTFPVTNKSSFVLGFIHSVEKTPVESEYRVLSGKIRQWEERFISQNAGLPTEAPQNGRFIMDRKWMILRGGGLVARNIRYRVGNDLLGRNRLLLPDGSELALYEDFPGDILVFSAETTDFLRHGISRVF